MMYSDPTHYKIHVLLTIYFHLSLPTGCTYVGVCTSVLGSLFAMLFALDGAFLSWSSFKFDTVQVING